MLGVLFCWSCFALLVVVSMMTIELVRSRFCISFSVRCNVNVLYLVMLYFCLVLLLFIVVSAVCSSVSVVFLWLLSWKMLTLRTLSL